MESTRAAPALPPHHTHAPTRRTQCGRVARATPDGYTLRVGQWSTHVLNGAAYTLSYDLLKDFEPVALIATNPEVIVTNTAIPAKNLAELIAWLKPNQGNVSVGIGSMSHL